MDNRKNSTHKICAVSGRVPPCGEIIGVQPPIGGLSIEVVLGEMANEPESTRFARFLNKAQWGSPEITLEYAMCILDGKWARHAASTGFSLKLTVM